MLRYLDMTFKLKSDYSQRGLPAENCGTLCPVIRETLGKDENTKFVTSRLIGTLKKYQICQG